MPGIRVDRLLASTAIALLLSAGSGGVFAAPATGNDSAPAAASTPVSAAPAAEKAPMPAAAAPAPKDEPAAAATLRQCGPCGGRQTGCSGRAKRDRNAARTGRRSQTGGCRAGARDRERTRHACTRGCRRQRP